MLQHQRDEKERNLVNEYLGRSGNYQVTGN